VKYAEKYGKAYRLKGPCPVSLELYLLLNPFENGAYTASALMDEPDELVMDWKLYRSIEAEAR